MFPSLPMVVLLARHGRTPLNAAGLLRGRCNPDLDDLGRREAAELAIILALRRPGRVLSSPLERAVQTAQPIGAAAGVEVELSDDLIDRDYGAFNGTAADELVERFGSVDAAPGVEPAENVLARAMAALGRVSRQRDGRPVVLVSHDVVNRLLLAALDPELGRPDEIGQRTACFNEIVCRDRHWQVVQVDVKPSVPMPGA